MLFPFFLIVNEMFIVENLENREKYKEDNEIMKDANQSFGMCPPGFFLCMHTHKLLLN